MSPADTLRLILLSSLWGMSFIFMRVAVSALIWGYLLLGERLSLRVLVGMLITLLGTAIATRMIRLDRREVA